MSTNFSLGLRAGPGPANSGPALALPVDSLFWTSHSRSSRLNNFLFSHRQTLRIPLNLLGFHRYSVSSVFIFNITSPHLVQSDAALCFGLFSDAFAQGRTHWMK